MGYGLSNNYQSRRPLHHHFINSDTRDLQNLRYRYHSTDVMESALADSSDLGSIGHSGLSWNNTGGMGSRMSKGASAGTDEERSL